MVDPLSGFLLYVSTLHVFLPKSVLMRDVKSLCTLKRTLFTQMRKTCHIH